MSKQLSFFKENIMPLACIIVGIFIIVWEIFYLFTAKYHDGPMYYLLGLALIVPSAWYIIKKNYYKKIPEKKSSAAFIIIADITFAAVSFFLGLGVINQIFRKPFYSYWIVLLVGIIILYFLSYIFQKKILILIPPISFLIIIIVQFYAFMLALPDAELGAIGIIFIGFPFLIVLTIISVLSIIKRIKIIREI